MGDSEQFLNLLVQRVDDQSDGEQTMGGDHQTDCLLDPHRLDGVDHRVAQRIPVDETPEGGGGQVEQGHHLGEWMINDKTS